MSGVVYFTFYDRNLTSKLTLEVSGLMRLILLFYRWHGCYFRFNIYIYIYCKYAKEWNVVMKRWVVLNITPCGDCNPKVKNRNELTYAETRAAPVLDSKGLTLISSTCPKLFCFEGLILFYSWPTSLSGEENLLLIKRNPKEMVCVWVA